MSMKCVDDATEVMQVEMEPEVWERYWDDMSGKELKADLEHEAGRALASTPWTLAPHIVSLAIRAFGASGGEDPQGPDAGGEDPQGPDASRSRAGVCELKHEQRVLDEIDTPQH